MSKRIVMLCSYCFSTVTLYNHISRYYSIEKVITEEPMRGAALARRRLKKAGFITVTGQVLFSMLVVPLLRRSAKKRIGQIIGQYSFDETPIPEDKMIHVGTVNDEDCIALLKKYDPHIVIVNGTRIISKKVLDSTNAVFINMHTGITPKYRGVHGGYWALVNNDKEHSGVTVHLVDKGIDTGGVLAQEKINTTGDDNFVTYPYLQFGEGIPMVKKAVDDIMNGRLQTRPPLTTESRLWSHPTIWQYLYFRLFRNKK
jgi:folate-dependent phosphoribosylglycinamide formyltransferase PurN